MIDEEIMNTAIGKQDAKKLKGLLSKIDQTREQNKSETAAAQVTEKWFEAGAPASGSFSNKAKPVDQQTKFSSSSKVVVSKYSKSNSKTNLHDSKNVFGGRKTPGLSEPEEQDSPEEHHLEPLGGSEDDIDEFIKRHLDEEGSKKPDKTEEEKA